MNHENGPLWPAVIGMEEDTDTGAKRYFLRLDGREADFGSYEDAERAAENFLKYPAARAQWRAGIIPKVSDAVQTLSAASGLTRAEVLRAINKQGVRK